MAAGAEGAEHAEEEEEEEGKIDEAALSWPAFGAILAFRLTQGCLLRTYWTPDEFWQGHEVAHHMVYGCGQPTWEWRSPWMLRGPAHPGTFAALLVVMEVLSLDTPEAVAAAPRALQCVLAAVADCATYRLAYRLFGPQPAKWTLFCQLANWCSGYALVRPYSSSMEAALAIDVLSRFAEGAPLTTWLAEAALVCILRPTSAVLWVFPWLHAVACNARPLLRVAESMAVAAVAIMLAVGLDSMYYGTLTWSAINFVRFNLLQGHSAMYGTHHAAWYLTEGLPAMLGTMAPLPFLADRGHPHVRVLLATVALTVFLHSLSPHKELRFLLPVLPILLALAGSGLWRLFLRAPRLARLAVSATVLANACAFAFLGLRHQRAPMACIERLRDEMAAQRAGFSVDFLTTCHAAPFAAHLHMGLHCPDVRYLDCSPRVLPGGGLTREGTDSDLLVREGRSFVEAYYRRPASRRPRFVVVSKEIFENISSALLGYSLVERFDHNIESSEALLLLRRG